MPLLTGADVAIRSLGNKRGVVIEAERNGRYLVQVEGLTMWCREEDLAAAPERTKKKSARRPQRDGSAAASEDPVAAGRVDLHGLRVEDALERVITEIDHALLRGADRVEVVHGKGSGRIRDALHRALASMSVVASFRLDPVNPGVTWVYFQGATCPPTRE